MDKRNNKRKRVRLTLKAEPGSITAYSGDLSSSGLFIVTTKVMKPGTRVRLQFRREDNTIALGVGVVKWAKRVPPALIRSVKGGMGIEFTWLSPELKEIITKAIG